MPIAMPDSLCADSGAGSELKSEGVGSYWPFATGMKVTQANMLLKQMSLRMSSLVL